MAQVDSPQTRAPLRSPAARNGYLGPALLLAATAALAIIAVFNWPQQHAPAPPAPKPVDRFARLEQRLAADEARLARLEHAPGPNAGALDALASRVLEIATPPGAATPAPADLAARLDSYALKSDEQALAARVTKLESQDVAGAIRRSAAALALANLVRASEGASGFRSELQSLAAIMPDAPEAKDLARYAKGIPTEAMLESSFPRAADAALAADRRAHAAGWLDRLWVNISSLVTIRRVEARAGDDTESRLSRANASLANHDLEGAIREMQRLDATARDAASPWLAQAHARAAVDRDLRTLANNTVAALAQ
jgi:hypothetical protein